MVVTSLKFQRRKQQQSCRRALLTNAEEAAINNNWFDGRQLPSGFSAAFTLTDRPQPPVDARVARPRQSP